MEARPQLKNGTSVNSAHYSDANGTVGAATSSNGNKYATANGNAYREHWQRLGEGHGRRMGSGPEAQRHELKRRARLGEHSGADSHSTAARRLAVTAIILAALAAGARSLERTRLGESGGGGGWGGGGFHGGGGGRRSVASIIEDRDLYH